MPDARLQGNPLPEPDNHATLKRGPTLHGRAIRAGAELDYVREQMRRIAALADAGLRMEAREASAELLFDFQPVIVAHAEFVSQYVDVLRRCEATALQRRFLLAASGNAVTIPVRLTHAVGPSGQNSLRLALEAAERQSPMPVPIADMAKQEL
jgi:hypothetical protein